MSTWTIENLLREMHTRAASDLLLTPGTPPQLRVNGLLQPMGGGPLTSEATRALVHGLLSEGQLERLMELKSLDFSRGFHGLSRFRFNVYYQRNSMAIAARMIPFDVPTFEALSLPEIVKDFANLPHGLVLVTGATGSGKSTTQAAMIDYINHSRNVHIVCIEDPIEYLHSHDKSTVDQREVPSDCPSFAEALRSVFRQSPDVIMVGEMRDHETIQLALTLAETGHLILGTLHTQDASHAISRIVDAFPSTQQQQIYTQLAMVLTGVISQQLIVTKDRSRRVLAHEIIAVNSAIRNLIREQQVQQIYSAIQMGRSGGMSTMNECLRRLCKEDIVDPVEALKRSPRPRELEQLLSKDALI